MREQLQALSTETARIEYRTVDVTNEHAVHEEVQHIVARHGRIDGVLHAAGVLRDGFLLKKRREELLEVLAPKVQGTVYLDKATREQPLDFFVMFSSLAGSWGSVGQADYAAANAFMDGYASYRAARVKQGEASGRSVSLNWPLWKDGGMQVPELRQSEMNALGLHSLSNETGVQAFYAALATDRSQVLVVSAQPQLQKQPSAVQKETIERHTSSVEPKILHANTLHQLKLLLGRVLRLGADQLDEQEPLEHYGIDSILITQLNQQLAGVFGLLSKTLCYEYPTLSELCDYLTQNHAAACMHWSGLTTVASKEQPVAKVSTTLHRRQTPRKVVATNNAREPIAIIGVSGRYPQARTLDQYWENLKAGRNCITEIPSERWQIDGFYNADADEAAARGQSYSKWGGFLEGFADFDPQFFNISPAEAECMDPQERVFLQACWEVLEDAGYTRELLAKQHHGRVGVYAGITKTGFELHGPRLWSQGNASLPRTSFSGLANRVSHFLNLRGPSMPVDTMCSSSLTAIHEACEHLLRDECELAIAGGVNLYLHPANYIALCGQRMLSTDGHCRSFGRSGTGFVPGEGVGVIMLKRLSRAMADNDRIQGVIRATSISHGGGVHGYTVPNLNAQVDLIHEVLRKAGVDASSIDYIEAAAVGSDMADAIELSALSKVFSSDTTQRTRVIGSVKPNIGHAEAASGIAQVTKVLLQMRHARFAPLLRNDDLQAELTMQDARFVVQEDCVEWSRSPDGSARRALINSFGAGGAYASAIIEEYVPTSEPASSGESGPQAIVFSARNVDQLHEMLRRAWIFLLARREIPVPDLAWSLQVTRESMEYRWACVVESIDELLTRIREYLDAATAQPPMEFNASISVGGPESHARLKRLYSSAIAEAEINAAVARSDFAQLALLWAGGVKVPWQLAHHSPRKRVVLPSYPFTLRTFWFQGEPVQPEPHEPVNPPVSSGADQSQRSVQGRWRKHVATVLGLKAAEVPGHRSLRQLGFNSIMTISLRHALETEFQREIPLRLLDIELAIDEVQARLTRLLNDAPTPLVAIERASAEEPILPVILAQPLDRYAPFPLTDVQEAFFVGARLRGQSGSVGARIYFELTLQQADIYRLNTAWNRLIGHHEMLRAVVLPNGQQQILQDVPTYRFKVLDLRHRPAERASAVARVRADMIGRPADVSQWPLFDIRASLQDARDVTLHFAIDELIADGSSVQLLLQQWDQLYRDPQMPLPQLDLSFRDYVLSIKAFERTQRYKRSLQYWSQRLDGVHGGPELPLRSQVSESSQHARRSLVSRLEPQQWQSLQSTVSRLGVSETTLLLCVFAEVLRARSKSDSFALVMTFFNRLPVHPQIGHLVGPFASTNILVMKPRNGRSFEQIVHDTHAQLSTDLDHVTVSGVRALRELKARGKVGGTTALPVVFTSLINEGGGEHSTSTRQEFYLNETPQVHLDHQVMVRNGTLEFVWHIDDSVYVAGTLDQLFAEYRNALNELCATSGTWEPPVASSVEHNAALHAPFPLTDQQAAYAFARSKYSGAGANSCQCYQEIELRNLDAARLEKIWRELVQQHPMLRARVFADGTQRIMEEAPPFSVAIVDFRGKPSQEVAATLQALRDAMTSRIVQLGDWPYFELRASLLDNDRACIHFSIDMIIADGRSIALLLEQLLGNYANPSYQPVTCGVTFRDYVMVLENYRKTSAYMDSIRYWESKFANLPGGPTLPPRIRGAESRRASGHARLEAVFSQWRTLCGHAQRLGVSPKSVLLAAYLEVLAAWNARKPFTVVVPGWQRLPMHEDIDKVVGDFTAMTWVGCDGSRGRFDERVKLAHATLEGDLAHRAVSGLKVLRKVLSKDRARELIFPVVFSEPVIETSGHCLGSQFAATHGVSKTAQVAIDNISIQRGDDLVCCWDGSEDLLADGLAAEMFAGYVRVLEHFGGDVGADLSIDVSEIVAARPEQFSSEPTTDNQHAL
jgi:3-oxoacyl-(acyl-carrier-protein) synthase/non-ribosomal peptide synthetase component F/acyl carrier protein/short-subunit dehydrogenase/aryl carrier-like protein